MCVLLDDDDAVDVWYEDILQSVLNFADFVDANSLSVLQLPEFLPYRICFISNSLIDPIFSCFSSDGKRERDRDPTVQRKDIVIYYNGSHFTLLRPFMQPNGSFYVSIILSPSLLR